MPPLKSCVFQIMLGDIEVVHMLSFLPVFELALDTASYPKIAALKERFEKIPEIAQWMKERPESKM